VQADQRLSVQGLGFHIEGQVAFVTIDNEAEQNRLTEAALGGLVRIAQTLSTRNDVHVVVIRGKGYGQFSTGLLNPVLRAGMSKEAVIDLVMLAVAAFDAIEALPQIVIAGLNGIVRAGGVELALACDIRIAVEHARMCMPEARWGGFPGAGGPLRLARLVGRPRALELICTGREIDVREMEKIGFAQDVVTASEFDRALSEFTTRIATSGPLAIRGAKKIMKVDEQPGFDAACETSMSLRRQLEWSADVDEGLRALREGRAPSFFGR
jgi:enoyl-CoA hydratase/carnithine racemase